MPKGTPKTTSATVTRRAAATFPATVVQQLATLEQDLGGRAAVVGMLTLAPLTPDLRYLLGLLGDPQCASNSLAETCMLANVLPGELLKHLAAAALLAGKVRASQKIGAGIAAVAEDVMRRAAPFIDPCYVCQGTGTLTPEPTPQVPNPGPGPCETCAGSGKLLHQPDLDRQKLAVDLAQLLPKGAGIQIAQINAPAGGGLASGGGTLERLMQFTDEILYGSGQPPAVVEAETVEEGE